LEGGLGASEAGKIGDTDVYGNDSPHHPLYQLDQFSEFGQEKVPDKGILKISSLFLP